MRVLLVDHDAAALDKVTRALRGVVELDCVSTKADALMLLKQKSFDVLIACERAADGSGLDLLGRIGKSGGDLKRIFSAAPERLQLLGTRLQPFNVTRTISYPIDLEELWLALAAVTTGEDPSIEGTIEHIVMDESGQAPSRPAARNSAPTATSGAVAQPTTAATPTVAVAQGAAARKIATEVEPEPVRRAPPNPTTAPTARAAAQPTARAPANNSSTPPAPARSATPSARQLAAQEIAAAAAEALQTPPPVPKSRQPSGALLGGIVAIVALVGIAAALVLREPAQPVAIGEPPATPDRTRAETSASTAGQIAALEARIEDALLRDDLAAANAANAELASLAPSHPRLAFFTAALERASQMNTLNRPASRTPAVPPTAAPSAPAVAAAEVPHSEPATEVPVTQAAAATPPPVVANETPSPTVEARTPNRKPRAENGKFQGRTLEETSATRKTSGTAAPLVAPVAEPPQVTADAATAVEPASVTAAKLVKRVAPEYPPSAADRGTEGYVLVEFTVAPDGRVIDPVIIESSPRRTFDSAARDAVRRWKYEPARQGDAAIASTARVRLEFQLAD